MPRLADATAYLKTDNSELKKGLDQGEQDVSGWGGKLGSVMQGVGMAVGLGVANIAADAAGKVVGFMADSVSAASDLNETLSKTGVVFGENSAAVLAWSETAATALGQSKAEALGAASTFGNLFVSMGMATGPSADMSMGLVKLAGDLASFNNIDPGVALEKLRAGMLGQAEPMQALGVNMTAASVTAKALEMGLAGTADALTPAMLAQARYAIILEQTKTAQGDFAKTSDGLANQQRIMDAQWKDLSATVGQALLPVVLAFTSALNTLVQAVLPPLQAFMTERVIPVMTQFGALIEATLGPALNALMGWFSSLGQTVQGTTDGPLSYMQSWWAENMPRIQQIVEKVLGALTAFWEQHGAAITATVETLLTWMSRFWDTQMRTILDLVEVVLQLLTGDFEGAGETLRGIVERWYDFFRDGVLAIVHGVRSWFQSIDWGAVGQAMVDGIWHGMQGAWGNLENWFWDRLDGLRDMLPFSEPKDPDSPLRGLRESGAAIVDMLRQGVAEAGQLMAPRLDLAGASAGMSGGAVNVTINIYGVTDANGVGGAASGGVLDGLRAAGWRG
jgi:phage-related protein